MDDTSTTIEWTDATRPRRIPCRDDGERRGKQRPLARLWATVHGDARKIVTAVTNVVHHSKPADRVQAVVDTMRLESAPEPGQLDVETAAMFAVALGVGDGNRAPVRRNTPADLVDLFELVGGPGFVVRVLVATLRLQRNAYQEKTPRGTVVLKTFDEGGSYWPDQRLPGVWLALRQWACTLPDDAWREALAEAHAQRAEAGASTVRRCLLAYAFDLADEAIDDAHEVMASSVTAGHHHALLFGALRAPDVALALAASRRVVVNLDLLPTLVERLGARSLEVIPAIALLGGSQPEQLAARAEAIAMLVTDEAAAWLARHADEPACGATVANYGQRHPGLLVPALEAAGTGQLLLDTLQGTPAAPPASHAATLTTPSAAADLSTEPAVHPAHGEPDCARLPVHPDPEALETRWPWPETPDAMRARLFDLLKNATQHLQRGLRDHGEAVAPAARAIVEQVGDDELPVTDDIDREAAFARLVATSAYTLTWTYLPHAAPFLVLAAVRGPVFAMEVLLASMKLNKLSGFGLAVGADPDHHRSDHIAAAALRHWLATETESNYAACRDRAAELREDAPDEVRHVLAFLFPTEPWGQQEAEAVLERPTLPPRPWYERETSITHTAQLLLAAARKADTLDQLAGRLLTHDAEDPRVHPLDDVLFIAPHLVDALGVAADEHLIALYRLLGSTNTGREGRVERQLLALLERTETPAVVELVLAEGWLEDWLRRPHALRLLRRRPALALPALLAAPKKGKAGKCVVEVLAWMHTAHPDWLSAQMASRTAAERKRVAAAAPPTTADPVLAALPAWLQAAPSSWKTARAPAFWSPASFPSVRLRSGAPLPSAAYDALLALFVNTPPGRAGRQPEHDDLEALCEPASLAAFTLALVQAWLASGAPTKEKWVIYAVGHLGGDAIVAELAPEIRTWPGAGHHKRAVMALDAFVLLGTDGALRELAELSQRNRYRKLREEAEQRIEEVAAARGLSREALEDRLVPDLGLSPRSTAVFVDGADRYTVRVSADLEPVLTEDATGKILRNLPRAAHKDVRKQYDELRRELATIGPRERARLERAMVFGRTWPTGVFVETVASHPLLAPLVDSLVWALIVRDADGDRRVGLARVERGAEGLRLVDASGAVADPASFERVGPVHPTALSADELRAWRAVFGPETQGLEQLYRTTHDAPSGAVPDDAELRHLKGRTVSLRAVRKLLAQGWSKGSAEDHGSVWQVLRALPGGTVQLHFDSPVPVSMPSSESVTLDVLELPRRLGALPGVTVSEALRDLQAAGVV